MSKPISRKEHIDYCLRALGEPMLKVNVTRDQLDDRVDDGLRTFLDFHYDGVEEANAVYMFTEDDYLRDYIVLPANVVAVAKVSPINGINSSNVNPFFDVQYQLLQSDFLNRTGVFSIGSGISYFQMTRHYLSLLQTILSPEVTYQWNAKTRRLHLQRNLGKTVGVALKLYTYLDYENADAYESKTIWSDRWLLKYNTALIKKQWGENLSKFNGPLPGGITINGDRIRTEATQELAELYEELRLSYSLMPEPLVG